MTTPEAPSGTRGPRRGRIIIKVLLDGCRVQNKCELTIVCDQTWFIFNNYKKVLVETTRLIQGLAKFELINFGPKLKRRNFILKNPQV